MAVPGVPPFGGRKMKRSRTEVGKTRQRIGGAAEKKGDHLSLQRNALGEGR
jgi:hypothetical protein